jgi:hypothetical protein
LTWLALPFALAVRALAAAGDAPPPEPPLPLPLTVWDVNFNQDAVDLPPAGPTKAELEAWQRAPSEASLPKRTYDELSFVSRTRHALVLPEAAGLKDKPLQFTWTENAQPHYGPRLALRIPQPLAEKGRLWRFSLDVAKGNVAISGGIHLWDVANIEFFEDGTLKANGVDVSRYAANRPLHLDCLISVKDKTLKVTVDGKAEPAVTVPWWQPKARQFGMVLLQGLLPGGHCEAPSSIVFDNIRLVLVE